jgi:hypothetical protein
MRLVLNILIGLMVIMLLAGVAWQRSERSLQRQHIEQTRHEVAQFHRVIALQSALNNIERSSRGYPLAIDPEWFDGELPTNPLLTPSHPWLEIAHPDQGNLFHPPVRAAISHHDARFWYNPANGIVRARVPRAASDAATLRLYNTVNGTKLTALLPDPESLRTPAGRIDHVDEDEEQDDSTSAESRESVTSGGVSRARQPE